MSSIKLRAHNQDGTTTVRALIRHPMETGLRLSRKTGDPVPAHHIIAVEIYHQDQLVLSTDWGPGISTNPYLSIRFRGGRQGELVRLAWSDNLGKTDYREVTIR